MLQHPAPMPPPPSFRRLRTSSLPCPRVQAHMLAHSARAQSRSNAAQLQPPPHPPPIAPLPTQVRGIWRSALTKLEGEIEGQRMPDEEAAGSKGGLAGASSASEIDTGSLAVPGAKATPIAAASAAAAATSTPSPAAGAWRCGRGRVAPGGMRCCRVPRVGLCVV